MVVRDNPEIDLCGRLPCNIPQYQFIRTGQLIGYFSTVTKARSAARPSSDLIAQVERELFVETPIVPADLLFIFGNRTCEDEYAEAASQLWSHKFFSHVLVTGGITGETTESEASVIGGKLMARGIPRDRILLECAATNTGQNVEYALSVLDAQLGLANVRSVIAMGMVCTSRRYLMTLERYWPQVRKMLYVINYFGRPLEKWPDHPDMRTRIIGEWRKLSLYKAEGFIVEWPPPNL